MRVHHVVVKQDGALGGKAAAILYASYGQVLLLDMHPQEIRAAADKYALSTLEVHCAIPGAQFN